MRVRVDRRPRPPGIPDPGYTPPRSLPDTEPLRPGSGAIGELVRVDVAALLSSGGVTIEVNDPTFEPHVAKQFDGDTRWPSRSDSINPLVFELEFTAPIRLAAARFFPFGPKSAWSIEARAGERWSLAAVDPGQWSQLDLPEPVETNRVRIELLRVEGDDNVHVSELELYAAPAAIPR
jgi:hypothetical protein